MNLLLAVLVVNRTEGLLEKAADARFPLATVDPIRFSNSWDVAVAAMMANDLGLIWIMVMKPSATASIGVLAAAIAVFVEIALARRGGTGPIRSEGRERSVGRCHPERSEGSGRACCA